MAKDENNNDKQTAIFFTDTPMGKWSNAKQIIRTYSSERLLSVVKDYLGDSSSVHEGFVIEAGTVAQENKVQKCQRRNQ